MDKLKELEEERLRKITEINEIFSQKKELIRNSGFSLEKFSFEIVCGMTLNSYNEPKFARRRAIFIHDLNKYFDVKPKVTMEEVEEDIEKLKEGVKE